MHEMGRRALSDNTKDAIQLDENNVFKIHLKLPHIHDKKKHSLLYD
jgi:hypothetical protein